MSQSQENNEDELEELSTWQETAEKSMNIITFKGLIEDFTLLEPENEEDRLPDRLLEVGNTILYISMKIESVRSHKEDFERLLGHASSLVVVFWQLCNKSEIRGKLWPPPNLRNVIDKLVDTVYYIHKLMKRKSQESLAKRIVVGYFGLRDLRKFKKYQRKLDNVASSFESEPHNVKINKILLEVIRNRTQDQHEDSSAILEPEEPVEEPVRKKKRAVDQEASTERTRSRKAKPKQNEVEGSSEDGHVDGEETKAAKKKTAGKQPEARSKGTKKATSRCSSDEESEDEGKRARYQESDEDVAEGPSRQRSRTTNATKSQTKKRVSPVDDEDEESNTDVPVTSMAQPKKKKRPVLSPKQKVESTPVSPQYSISGFSFNNNGSGNMANLNVGNIYHSSISDAYNDNSTNGKRKPA